MLNVTPSIWVELFSDERKENPGNGRSRFTNVESSPEVGAKQRRSLSQRQTFRNPASQIFGNLFCQTQGPGKLDRFEFQNLFILCAFLKTTKLASKAEQSK